jgi:hypothetical protein
MIEELGVANIYIDSLALPVGPSALEIFESKIPNLSFTILKIESHH